MLSTPRLTSGSWQRGTLGFTRRTFYLATAGTSIWPPAGIVHGQGHGQAAPGERKMERGTR